MADIISPISGEVVTNANVGNVCGLLYADLAKLVDGADIETRYPEFDRSYGEWGAIIQEGRIGAASATDVDKDATNICGPYYFSVDSRYYDDWVEKKFPSELRRIDLTKVCRNPEEYETLLRLTAERNMAGYKKFVNKSVDAMFLQTATAAPANPSALIGALSGKATVAEAVTNGGGFLNPKTQTANNAARYEIMDEGATYPMIWKEVLRNVLHMKVENNTYTEGAEEYGLQDISNRMSVYIPIDFYADTNIEYLQNLFRLNGMDKIPTIREHNGADIVTSDGKRYGVIYLLDHRVVNHVNRAMYYDEAEIMCRKSNMIDLHTEDMVKYSPFYKAWAIVFNYDVATANVEVVNG